MSVKIDRLLREAKQKSDTQHAIQVHMIKERLRQNPILKDMAKRLVRGK